MSDDDDTPSGSDTGGLDGRSGGTFDSAALTPDAFLEQVLTLTTGSASRQALGRPVARF